MKQKVIDWINANKTKLDSHSRLAPARIATTVTRNGSAEAVVTDGPFTEASEVVGGYAIVNVRDLDEAIAMAKSWPVGPVEIRALV